MNAEVLRVLQDERDFILRAVQKVKYKTQEGDVGEWEAYGRDVQKRIRDEIKRAEAVTGDMLAIQSLRKWWKKLAIANHNGRIAFQRGGAPSPTTLGDISEASRELRRLGEKI